MDYGTLEADGLVHSFFLSEEAKTTFRMALHDRPAGGEQYLFRKKSKNEPLAYSVISTMIKGWFSDAGFEGSFSGRSLYKTWQVLRENKPDVSKIPEQSSVPEESSDTESVKRVQGSRDIQNGVLNWLYDNIASGAISMGSKLVAGHLAQQFKVSTTPVRIALAHLEEQGLIVMQGPKTCIVNPLTLDEADEIFTLRLALENKALDLLEERWTAHALDYAEGVLRKLEGARSLQELVRYHIEFHVGLYHDLNMPLLTSFLNNLNARVMGTNMSRYGQGKIIFSQFQKYDLDKHYPILAAFRSQDFATGRKLLLDNIREGHEKCRADIIAWHDFEF